MVRYKKTLLFLVFVLVFSVLFNCCQITDKQVSDKDLAVLNTCYDLANQAFSEGFVKNNANFFDNRELFVYALENELYDTIYSKSKFNGRAFYFLPGNKKNGSEEFQEDRCKDTLIAMHLAYTLAYDTENFENEFISWYPTIDFYLSEHSEFVYLILEHYDCNVAELDIIVNAFAKLSEKTSTIADRYQALNTAYFMVMKYNELHDENVVEFPDELDKSLKEYADYIKENPNEVAFWSGYTLNG